MNSTNKKRSIIENFDDYHFISFCSGGEKWAKFFENGSCDFKVVSYPIDENKIRDKFK